MAKKVLILPGALTVGGAEKMARDIALYAPTGKWEFHYLVFGNTVGEYEARLKEAGCTIFHVPQPRENHFGYLVRLIHRMKREGYAIVHAHTMFSCGWAMVAARIAGIPRRIAHAHSALQDGGGWVKSCYERVMGWLIVRCATDLAACAPAAGKRLFGKHWQRRGLLLPNGIQRERFAFDSQKRSAIRHQYGLENRFVVGHAGHLNEVKNQRFLLEILPELLKSKPNTHLLLLGDGEDRALLENRISALELGEHVTLAGNVTDVGGYLSAMDVFAFPSLYEGAPLALLEARANGLPCVVSDRVEERGIPLENPQSWVKAIVQARRGQPAAVLDIREAMERVYELYEQNQNSVSH